MKTFFKILGVFALVLVLLLGGLAAFIATRPAEFSVARSATITAPADRVFARINDLRQWQEFSPWAELDPDAKVSFAGPPAGEGASFAWDGDANIGAGSMTIIESRPAELVRYRLDFVRPFAGTSESSLALAPSPDGGTTVTWTMSGDNNFIGKAISLVIDCEEMIGPQFEQGLANLKRIVEQPAGS
ncbi:MAG: SRPBCC family protein [Verrucomicrobiota bacterium]